ncbi:MAG: NAD(P)-binding protein, partial [Cyclobacteriaceae bacterium]|nr:NAD(P)-binding protein [Cyclobacteriaceae bacterium]
RKITGTIGTPNYKVGHLLQTIMQEKPDEYVRTDCVVIGGGVSGLAASRKLQQQNIAHVLLELETKFGGNAQAGQTNAGAYPFGAHYITVPTLHDTEYLSFLKSCNIIISFRNELPVLNEYHICYDLKERLFIHGQWQEGLLPLQGITQQELDDIKLFAEKTEYYKKYIGKDGLPAFTLPIAFCSSDPALVALDAISFSQWLINNGLTGKPLLWYLNYCMADDFGGTVETVSAWAGLHYFASHHAKAHNADEDAVITWPEGNNWLVNELKKQATPNCKTSQLVFQVVDKGNELEVFAFDIETGRQLVYRTKQVISCVPQFVNQHLFSNIQRQVNLKHYTYTPWLIANLVVKTEALHGKGVELAWDNVIYDSKSLGYVHANHQHVAQRGAEALSNITYYKPFAGQNAKAVRDTIIKQTYQQWYDDILLDIKNPHPEIENSLQQLDVWLWGHGMIQPSVGFLTRPEAKLEKQSYRNKIHFAHSDLAGISVFEEGFYAGTQAALKVLQA